MLLLTVHERLRVLQRLQGGPELVILHLILPTYLSARLLQPDQARLADPP